MFSAIFILTAFATALPTGPRCISSIADLSNKLKTLRSGNTLTVCPGVYNINSPLELLPSASNSKLKCQGIGQCIFSKTTGNSQILLVNANRVLIDGFVFRDSHLASGEGGAVKIIGGNNFIANCQFINNSAPYGGALYSKGALNLIDTSFTQNRATFQGGAVYAAGKFVQKGSSGGLNVAGYCNNIFSRKEDKCLNY